MRKPPPTNKLLGLPQGTSLYNFISGITVFLHSILFKMLLLKVPPSLFVVLIPPLASSHIKFRFLSFNPKHLSTHCHAIHLNPHSSRSWALPGAAALAAEILKKLILHFQVWVV